MGKYVLPIGLVHWEEHLCNSCYLRQPPTLDEPNYLCRASWPMRKIEQKNENGRTLLIRDMKKCPLISVDKWPDETETTTPGGFDLT